MSPTNAPPHDVAASPALPVPGSQALLGGLLWVAYGCFEFLSPWGTDAVHDADRGYEVVVDRLLFTIYTGTGALALLLCCQALLDALRHLPGARAPGARTGRAAAALGLASALAALFGVVVAFDPLATGMRVVGSLLLGGAATAAARAVREHGRHRAALLRVLGAVGLFLLPLWPLVYAVELLPAVGGTAVLAGFGLTWMALGWDLSRAGASVPPPR